MFRVQGLGCRVQGLGLRVGVRVRGLRLKNSQFRVEHSGYGCWGVSCILLVQGSVGWNAVVWGLGFRVQWVGMKRV